MSARDLMPELGTLEHRIKSHHGLPVGMSLVRFTLGKLSREAIVQIGSRGDVFYLIKPEAGDMYSSWRRIRGNCSRSVRGAVIVWAARDAALMRNFEGVPVADIQVRAKP